MIAKQTCFAAFSLLMQYRPVRPGAQEGIKAVGQMDSASVHHSQEYIVESKKIKAVLLYINYLLSAQVAHGRIFECCNID